MATTTFPTVHLNGTSGQELLDLNREAASHLRVAITVMGEATPNGRDYYVQGGEAFKLALLEHLDRLERIKALVIEFDIIAANIEEQVEARRRK